MFLVNKKSKKTSQVAFNTGVLMVAYFGTLRLLYSYLSDDFSDFKAIKFWIRLNEWVEDAVILQE